ncbi:hypothetical protein Mgra_00002149 [Meloidogyne graminicola]|uniref:Uncharacterized protein n=1 Tax=Meloidogyne graminicola TaxID=189291 RepID=A0A8S9ZYY0_9BILA|nr:hypothetical protein Mgra_00002149 [Meloidogyne graminicola]
MDMIAYLIFAIFCAVAGYFVGSYMRKLQLKSGVKKSKSKVGRSHSTDSAHSTKKRR